MLLSHEEIQELFRTILEAGRRNNDVLISGLPAAYKMMLPQHDAQGSTLLSWLHKFNNTRRLTTDQIPMLVLLHNAMLLTHIEPHRSTLQRLLEVAQHNVN